MNKKWIGAVLMLCLITCTFEKQIQASSGDFKLKTDVISNGQVNSAEVGEFPIRGQLFLDDFSTKISQLEKEQLDVKQIQAVINFDQKVTDSSNGGRSELASLFKDYNPAVVVQQDETAVVIRSWLGIILFIVLLLAAILGVFLGNWWTKNRRKWIV